MQIIRTFIEFIRDKEYRELLLVTLSVLFTGTLVYHLIEGWSWIDALYFCVITLSTIGYGDFTPQTPEGKLFTIFYIIVGIGIILSFINTIYHHFSKSELSQLRRTMRENRRQSSSVNESSPEK